LKSWKGITQDHTKPFLVSGFERKLACEVSSSAMAGHLRFETHWHIPSGWFEGFFVPGVGLSSVITSISMYQLVVLFPTNITSISLTLLSWESNELMSCDGWYSGQIDILLQRWKIGLLRSRPRRHFESTESVVSNRCQLDRSSVSGSVKLMVYSKCCEAYNYYSTRRSVIEMIQKQSSFCNIAIC
jgi:hypothetical protein